MTISVLMSVYKAEKPEFLDRALRSVWDDQIRKPEQIVLVEDGPLTKELSDVIVLWGNKLGNQLTMVVNPTNLGLTKSLNRGLEEVTTDLVARMDSDDISTPKRLLLQETFMESHPDIAVVGGSLQEFDNNNACLNIRHYPQTHEEVRKYILKACPVAHPSVMMRMSIFREGGLKYDERFRMSQDIQLWYDVLMAGYKIANIQEVLLFFRREGDVFKRRSRMKAKNEFHIYMHGIYRMQGLFTLAYCYPIARYVFRNLPPRVVKWIYGSRMRKKILE